jgi:hypothetical protein
MITIDPRQNAEFIGDMPRIRGSAFSPLANLRYPAK